MPRLFAGLELPAALRAELDALSTPITGAKWVDEEDLHLTLTFAGDIDNRTADDFATELSSIDARVFELRVMELGAFGGNDPHAIWAGLGSSPELDQLQKACDRAARVAGIVLEKRKFKPHITLARLRGASPIDVARWLERHGAYRSQPFTVEAFVLFSSRPGTGGGPYGIEETFPLAGSAGFNIAFARS